MTSPNNQETRDSGPNALRALSSLQPPAGMQERITQNISERVHQQQNHPVARGLRKYAWEMWAGASIAVVATAVILCIFALQSHPTVNQPQVAIVETRKIDPTTAHTPVTPTNNAPHKAAHSYRVQKEEAATIPHTPPPQPLTSQERLLLTLANSPSLAAGVAQSQTISQHGLGTNALFELDHEQLQPMRSESKLLQPLPPLPNNLP